MKTEADLYYEKRCAEIVLSRVSVFDRALFRQCIVNAFAAGVAHAVHELVAKGKAKQVNKKRKGARCQRRS